MGKNRIPRTPADRVRVQRYRQSLRPATASPTSAFRREQFIRALLSFLAVLLILGAIHTLRTGGIGYRNYWGGTIFAPVAIAIGVAILLLCVFAWPRLRSFRFGTARRPFVFPGSSDEWRKW